MPALLTIDGVVHFGFSSALGLSVPRAISSVFDFGVEKRSNIAVGNDDLGGLVMTNW